jgi:hypothetical protein
MTICTSFYKDIEVQAEDDYKALDAAYEWMEENDAIEGAEIETEVHDIEEVTK